MELKFKRKEIKYEVENLNLEEQDCITMIELFVKEKLDDEAQEVFYVELENKEVNVQNIKDALYQATLANVSLKIIKKELEEHAENPDKYIEKVKQHMKK